MNSSIVCGVDDSESAKGAARVARLLSARFCLRLVFVRVVEEGSDADMLSAVAARLHRVAENATDVDCGAQWIVDVGDPAERLVAVAAEQDAVLIVVGSSGPDFSPVESVSADVTRRARCPVVVVAPGADRALTERRSDGPVASGNGAARPDPDAVDFAGGIVRFSLGGHKR